MKHWSNSKALITACAVAVAGSPVLAQEQQVLRVGQVGDVASLEPYRAPGANLVFMYNLLGQFLSNDRGQGFAGEMAESWDLASDSMSMTVKLREGLTTHAGVPVDANMVKWNFEERVTQKDKGAAHYNQVAPYFGSIDVIDELTFRLNFSNPAPHFEEIMAIVPITDPDMFTRDDGTVALANQEDKIISTGPFMLTEYVPDSHMYWEKFDDYWDADNVELDRIEVRFFGSGPSLISALEADEIDVAWMASLEDAARFQGNPDFDVLLTDTGAAHSIVMVSPENGITRDIRVRQAINSAINRNAINAAAKAGLATPQSSPVPQHSFAYSESSAIPLDGDVEKARSLITEAGAEGATISLTYPGSNQAMATTAAVIQQNLKEVGLNVELDPAESGVYRDRRINQNFEMLLSGYAGGNIHPAGLTNSFVFNPGETNGFFNDLEQPDPVFQKYGDAFRRGMAATTPEGQREAFVEAVDAIIEGSWVIVLSEDPLVFIADSSVEGITWPHGPRPIFSDVRIQK